MYCTPKVKNCVRRTLSGLSTAGALCAKCQFEYWSMKLYSKNNVPPDPEGNWDGVPTSKTPQPQAQAQLGTGVRLMRTTATSRYLKALETPLAPPRGRPSASVLRA